MQSSALLREFLLVVDYRIAPRHHDVACLPTSDITRTSLVIRTSWHCGQRLTHFLYTFGEPGHLATRLFVLLQASVHNLHPKMTVSNVVDCFLHASITNHLDARNDPEASRMATMGRPKTMPNANNSLVQLVGRAWRDGVPL